jgi:hypothetical protein
LWLLTGEGDKKMAAVQVGTGIVAVGLILVAVLAFYQGRKIDRLRERIEALEKKRS